MLILTRKIAVGLWTLGAVILLSGCTGWNVDAAKDACPTGSPFTKALHKEYVAFVDSKVKLENWESADYFARKALAAACGTVVLPEDPAAWNVPACDLPELIAARARLLALLDANARTTVPDLAAVAQVKYDCWVEGKGQICNPCQLHCPCLITTDDRYPCKTEACRCDFFATIEKIEQALKKPVVVKKVVRTVVPAEIRDQK